MTGLTFGRLEVLGRGGSSKNGSAKWLCQCNCGKKASVLGQSLRSGHTQSCGCLQKEKAKEVQLANIFKHGECSGGSSSMRFQMFHKAKKRAKNNNLPFDITIADIPCIPTICPILGIPISKNSKSGPHRFSPSLDRIRPERGYVRGNIRIISHRANNLKNDATSDELRAILADVLDIECT